MTVQYFDIVTQKLVEPQETKIRKLLELNLLHKESDLVWKCDPIPGYNVRTYTIKRAYPGGPLKCNCQGFNKRGVCSHYIALQRFIREERSNVGQKELF